MRIGFAKPILLEVPRITSIAERARICQKAEVAVAEKLARADGEVGVEKFLQNVPSG
jgi:hypothetical protein